MLDLASVRQSVDLLALAERYTHLRRESRREWSGPCPRCGGTDRFHVHASGWWFCRQCHERRGDVIELLRWAEGLSFREAVQRLGGGALPVRKPAQPEPERKPYPGQEWQARAWAVVEEAEAALWSERGERARAWLAGRGIGEAALLAFRIGLCEGGQRHGFRLERGILLPWWRGDTIWALNLRLARGNPKYQMAAGSVRNGLYGAHYLGRGDTLLICEGELDCALAWQEAGDILDVTTAGSAGALPGPEWLPLLAGYRRVLVCTDADQAGEEGAHKWLGLLGRRARRIMPPGGHKDVSDAWRAGHDLREWLRAELERD